MLYPRKITIPAAGDRIPVNQAGLAVVVQSVGIYTSIEQKPKLFFDDYTNPAQDLNPGDVLVPNEQGKQFQRVFIEGTTESAGQDLYLQFSTVCMDPETNPVTVNTFELTPGTTFTKTANDGAQSLTELELQNANGDLPRRVDISVSPTANGDGIKWALNVDPQQGNDTIGTKLSAGQNGNSGLLEASLKTILALRFIAETNTVNATVNFTPYY